VLHALLLRESVHSVVCSDSERDFMLRFRANQYLRGLSKLGTS
jgi:hypothetical protein